MTGHRPASQLCLQFESSSDGVANLSRLALALRTVSFSSVILSGPAGQSFDAALLQPLIALVQSNGIAALLHGEAQWARDLSADGVHVPWGEDIAASYASARAIMGTKFIAGADAGRSRHDAMALAEAGADYIGFGIPPHVEDREVAAGRRLDLAEWWAEIFEIPVMALDVETAGDVAALSAVQTDFIAVRLAASATGSEFEAQLLAMTAAREPVPA